MILFFDRKNNSLTLDNSINDKSLMDIKSEESGSESSRRWKREIKDIFIKEDIKEKKNEEINDSRRRIRTYNSKKVEEYKEENNEEKRDTY